MATTRFARTVCQTAAACAATLGLLSACGKEPATSAPLPAPSGFDPLPQVSIPTSVAPLDPTAPGADGAALVARAVAAFKALPAYTARMTFFQQAHGKAAVTGLYQLDGQAPRTLKIQIVSGTGQGTHLLWQGGSTVTVRPSGLLSAITLNLGLDDARLVSVRGYTLEQTDFTALLSALSNPHNKVGAAVPGPQGVSVTATGSKLLDGIVTMTATFDPQTYFPRKVEMTDGHEVVLRFVISGMHAAKATSLSI